MRLLVIVNLFAPDRGGGGAVYSDMCFALAERGIDVTVYCPYPFFPEWKDKSGRNGLALWRYRQNGVNVVRYGFFIAHDPRSLWQRMLFEVTLLLSLLRLVPTARRFDAVMVYCPHFSAVVAAALIKALWRRPLWLNVQDLTTAAAVATGMLRTGALTRLLSATERMFYNVADIWSSISPVMIEKLSRLRDRDQPILFLPNWVDAALSEQLAAHAPTSPAEPHGPIRLLYAGNISRKQNLIDFCRFLQASNVAFDFRIFGGGGGAAELATWLASTDDARFRFGAFLDARRLAEELADAHLYVITEQPGAGDSFFPSKLVTGMAAGTPILAICDETSPLGQEMRAAEPGPRFGWTELDQVLDLLRRLPQDSSDWQRWRVHALARASFYDRNAIIDRLQAHLERIASGRPVLADAAVGDVPAR